MRKTKYNPDDWVRGASNISSFLGITRMTLYRWSKILPLERAGGTNNWNKERFGSHSKVSLIKWAVKILEGSNKRNYTVIKAIREARNSLSMENVT